MSRAHANEVSQTSRTRRYWLLPILSIAMVPIGLYLTLHLRKPSLDRAPGRMIADFELPDVNTGHPHRLSDHSGRVVVLVFTGTSCPVGDLYTPRLVALSKEYSGRAVDFLAINSNASETIDDVAAHARERGVNFPVLKDLGNTVADQVLAERTCEVLVVDVGCRLCYRGAIDDQYGLGARRDLPVRNYLVDALEAVLHQRTVSPAITPVVGCPIERSAPPESVRHLTASRGKTARLRSALNPETSTDNERQEVGPVAYSSEVAAIIDARCASCHRPGQVAPFSLLNYDDAQRWAISIAEVVTDGRMPPWHADSRYGHFANDRGLTARERAVLLAWVEQGSPPGDAAARPIPRAFSHGWSIGEPDVIVEMPRLETIPAEGTVPIKRIRVPLHVTSDLWIQAAEARPGDRAVVHHICVFIDDHVKTIDGKPKYKHLLVSYTPGDMPSVFPPGIARLIPAGSDLLFEVHYTPIGKPRFDRSSVGLILSKAPPRHLAIARGVAQHQLEIPAGAADHIEHSEWTTKGDVHLLSMTPHMHLRGKSFLYKAFYPNGRAEILLSVPAYDFNWQSVYRLVDPKPLPKGTRIHCEAHFDNSTANAANPDPTVTVRWGEQTEDEMMIGFVDYFDDTPFTASPRAAIASDDLPARLRR